jgi:hypothetical protein
MPAIVCSVGFYLSGCTIEAFPDEYDTPCMYSALVALASTAKNGAQDYVKNSFSAIEKYYETLPIINSQNNKIKKYVVTNSESPSIFQHKNKNQNVAKKTCPENSKQNNIKSVSGTNEKVMATQNNQPALKHVNKKKSNIQSEAPKSTAASNKSSTAINKKKNTKTPNQEV